MQDSLYDNRVGIYFILFIAFFKKSYLVLKSAQGGIHGYHSPYLNPTDKREKKGGLRINQGTFKK